MLSAVFGLCVVAAAVAAPASEPAPGVIPLEKEQPTVIPILAQSAETEANGTYKFSYETGNGIKIEESSYDKVLPKARSAHSGGSEESDESDEIHVQQGSYSYTAPDGTLISVRYIADENGFQPIGNHIPTVPPTVKIASSSSAKKMGRVLKSSDSVSDSSAPAPKTAAPATTASPASPAEKSSEIEGSGAYSTEAGPVSSSEPTEAKTTEASTETSTTEITQNNQEVSTESEITTKANEIENKTEELATKEDAANKETTTTEASVNEVTTKVKEESHSTEKSTEAAPLTSTMSESSSEITTTAGHIE